MSKDDYKKLTNLNINKVGDFSAVLVYSDTCPDCELALRFFPEEFPEVDLYLLDFDIEEELCDEWEVISVPQVVFLRQGKMQGKMWGMQEPVTNKGFIMANLERAKNKLNEKYNK